MERLEVFLNRLNSNYPLDITSSALCISLANSGRRGNAKEFHITLESFVSSLEDVRDNLDTFPASYDESAWRMGSDRFFTDNHAKSLCGVQTRPYFETVNKFVSWANELEYTEGSFSLTRESIEKTICEINVQCLKNVLHYPLFDEHSFAGLNEEQIVDCLAEKLIEERQNPRGAQYFGFKYARYLDAHTNIITSILRKAGVDSSVVTEIGKGRGVFNRALEEGAVVKWYCLNNINQPAENREAGEYSEDDLGAVQDPIVCNFTPTQIIYYGVPGTGKSFQVDEEINKVISKYNEGKTEDDKISYEKQTTRIVFHPDYGNADFIGQIMPKIREAGGVDYVFKAGPFSQILRKAYLNPNKPYFLVIEEINRGNAAAIFGDIFQSLDRLKNNETSDGERIRNEAYKYTAGWSKYGVTNEEINSYILDIEKNFERDSDINYDSDDPTNAPKAAIKIPARGMHFSINSAIRLPPNLSIYATMNTSDQNVFTLDNAFQRRWEMKQISNDLAHDDPAADTTKQYDEIIGNTNVKWGVFRDEINSIIMQSAEENGLSSMDDKRLGGWFITPKKEDNAAEGETPKITNEAFAEKVLKYLWDDAFKFDRSKHFGEIKTLEDLTKEFKKEGFKVFKDESISKLSQQNGTTAAQTGTPET